ncbi:TPA: MerR family transcriptional regulator [Salmonella enterica]|nr:MerR family transcriptional regulator [Salmonella enterica subsp. enterica serovar Hvittingfoss]
MILPPMGTPGKCPVCVRAWTQEEDELLINLHSSMSCDQIATALGRSVRGVAHRMSLLRDAGRLPYKKHQVTPEDRRFIRDNRYKMTIKEVAAALGISPSTVKYTARRMDVSYRKYGDMHRSTKYPDSDVELIRQLHDEYNLTFREVGKKFDISTYSCQRIYASRLTAIDIIAREYLPR